MQSSGGCVPRDGWPTSRRRLIRNVTVLGATYIPPLPREPDPLHTAPHPVAPCKKRTFVAFAVSRCGLGWSSLAALKMSSDPFPSAPLPPASTQNPPARTQQRTGHPCSDGLPRLVLCHRGTLDPQATWLVRGWDGAEFFASRAIPKPERYVHYEPPCIWSRLRRSTTGLWTRTARPAPPRNYLSRPSSPAGGGGHPLYGIVDNLGCDWAAKSHAAREALEVLWQKRDGATLECG